MGGSRVRLGFSAGRLAAMPALVLTFLFGASGSCTGESSVAWPPACTEEARASVMVSVLDGRGAPFPGATVTWRVDGREPQPAECADFGLLPPACARFVAGWEVAGAIEVRAEKAGFLPAAAAVTVLMDEFSCHVLTRDITLVMLPHRGDDR